MILILKYYCLFIVSILILHSLGWLILKSLSISNLINGFYSRVFANLLTGTIVSVILFSSIKTNFQTINIGFILLFVLMFLHVKKNNYKKYNLKPNRKQIRQFLFFIFCSSIFFFLFQLSSIMVDFNSTFVIPSGDYTYYSRLSEYLSLSGNENTLTPNSLFDESFKGFIPYHYFEIWLNSTISSLFQLNHLISFTLISFPIIFIIIYLGILSIFEHYNLINNKTLLISLLFLFFGSFEYYYGPINDFIGVGFGDSVLDNMRSKFSVYIPFTICGILFLIKNQKKLFILSLLSIIIVSSITISLITITISFYLFYDFILNKNKKKLIELFFTLIIVVLFFISFIYLFGLNLNSKDRLININEFFDLSTLSIRANILIKSSIQLLILYIPIIAPLILIERKKINFITILNSKILILCLCLFSGGIISWIIFYKNINSVQFLMISCAIINVLLLSSIIRLITNLSSSNQISSKIKFIYFTLIIFPIVFNFYDVYKSRKNQKEYECKQAVSNEFINSISNLSIDNPVGVSIKKTYLETRMTEKISPSYNLGYQYLCFTPNLIETIDIGVIDLPINKKDKVEVREKENLLTNNLFARFYKKNNYTKKNIVDAQINFMNELKINFLIVSKEIIIPPKIKKIITNEIIDSKTGDRFYLLNYTNI